MCCEFVKSERDGGGGGGGGVESLTKYMKTAPALGEGENNALKTGSFQTHVSITLSKLHSLKVEIKLGKFPGYGKNKQKNNPWENYGVTSTNTKSFLGKFVYCLGIRKYNGRNLHNYLFTCTSFTVLA